MNLKSAILFFFFFKAQRESDWTDISARSSARSSQGPEKPLCLPLPGPLTVPQALQLTGEAAGIWRVVPRLSALAQLGRLVFIHCLSLKGLCGEWQFAVWISIGSLNLWEIFLFSKEISPCQTLVDWQPRGSLSNTAVPFLLLTVPRA